MYNVNYDLIGSVPSMEIYRDVLPKLIAEYEASNHLAVEARRKIEALGSNHEAIATLLNENLKRPEVQARLSRGVVIELCAQHFYGIDTVNEYQSIHDVIDLLKSIDQELELK